MSFIVPVSDFMRIQKQALEEAAATGASYGEVLARLNAGERERKKKQEEQEALAPPAADPAVITSLIDEMRKLAAARRMGSLHRNYMPQVMAGEAKKKLGGGYITISPDELKPSQKRVDEKKVKAIIDDWDKVGASPIIISSDYYVLDGHHRVEAARRLGKKVRALRLREKGRAALETLRDVDA